MLPIPIPKNRPVLVENPTPRQIAEYKAALGILTNAEWEPFIETFDGVEMVLVPAGCFEMGNDELVKVYDWGTQCFYEPFWIDRFEVTNAEYNRFVADGGYDKREFWTDEGWEWLQVMQDNSIPIESGEGFDAANQPISGISWYQANAYALWRGCRLPTESEWEYAGRGPDNLYYPWGNEFIAENVVYLENSDEVIAEVGSKLGGASWVGALDMSGNGWEWTGTIWREHSHQYDSPQEEELEYIFYVIRGGSFWHDQDHVRLTWRFEDFPNQTHDAFGLRVVCENP